MLRRRKAVPNGSAKRSVATRAVVDPEQAASCTGVASGALWSPISAENDIPDCPYAAVNGCDPVIAICDGPVIVIVARSWLAEAGPGASSVLALTRTFVRRITRMPLAGGASSGTVQ